MIVGNNTELPSSLPTYKVVHGFGNGGPLYDSSEAVVDTITDNINNFLSTFDISPLTDAELTGFEYYNELPDPYSLTAETAIGKITSRVYKVSLIPEEDIPADVLEVDPDSNAIIKSCIAYMGFSDPAVIRTDDEYYIFDASVDMFSSDISSVNYILMFESDGLLTSLHTVRNVLEEAVGEYDVISYENALEAVKTEYPEIDTAKVSAICFWKYGSAASYDNGKPDGTAYYYPCYKLFIECPDGSQDGYAVVDIAMTTFNSYEED